MKTIKVGKYIIDITNSDKILFPKDKIKKSDVIQYYNNIGPVMLKYIKNHLISMHRFPSGITQEGFYHKDAPDFFPDWVKTLPVQSRGEDKVTNYVVATNVATLVYIAQFGCLTPHIWLSKADKLNYPDRMIFDLDPSTDKQFYLIKEKAKDLKKILNDLGLSAFVTTTGSRGLHVTTPLKRKYTFEQINNFADKIAQMMIEDDPKNLTTAIRKNKRENKIFIDTLRNSYTATAVAPYAIRAKNGAPVATPLFWEELDNKKLNPQSYNINNVFDKLKTYGDPWINFYEEAKTIKFKI
jgi:bifunctional non-homologous end joining protein LigD